MASRNFLQKDKLEDFKRFCDERNIPYRPGKGQWQVLQVLTEDFEWKVIYKRLEMPEHYSLDERLVPTVLKFLAWNKNKS